MELTGVKGDFTFSIRKSKRKRKQEQDAAEKHEGFVVCHFFLFIFKWLFQQGLLTMKEVLKANKYKQKKNGIKMSNRPKDKKIKKRNWTSSLYAT